MSERPASWHVARRFEALSGEERANLWRVIGIAVFYAIEVLNHHGATFWAISIPRVEGVDDTFHAMATALAAAWIGMAAVVVIALKNRFFPRAFGYITTTGDLLLLTSVLTLADGPKSPVLVAYFLVIALAGLRMNPRLAVFATAGALVGYAFLIADVATRRPELAVPPHWMLTVGCALALCGALVAQLCGSAQRAAQMFAALEEARLRSGPPEQSDD